MKKLMKTLAVAGMTMGLALGAKASYLTLKVEPTDGGSFSATYSDGSPINPGSTYLSGGETICLHLGKCSPGFEFKGYKAKNGWDVNIPVTMNGTDGSFTMCYQLDATATAIFEKSPVSYLEPVYKTIGGVTSPTNGIDHWETKSTSDYQLVTTSTAKLSAGWWVVDGTVSRSSACITVEGAVHLILKDGRSLTVPGYSGHAGIKVSGDGNSLVIYGQNAGTGKLTVESGTGCAGIGGDNVGDGSNITINGGTVTATAGSNFGAGIGGGCGGKGSNITINGGTVTATGSFSAGIGGSLNGAGSNITINGGTVTATGGNGGAGIGGGSQGGGSNITINGGTVTATGGERAAGIGSGADATVASSGIYVNPLMTLKADGNNPPTTVIPNTGADLADALKNKKCATVEPPTVAVISADGATTNGYVTMAEAMDKVKANETIRLLADIQLTKTIEFNAMTNTLDLAGSVLKGTGSGSVVTVNAGANLTITDTVATAVHYYTVDSNAQLWNWNDANTAGAVPYENLTARPAKNAVIAVKGGAITGGNMTGYGGGILVGSNATLTLGGGNLVGNKATLGGGGVAVGDDTQTGGSLMLNAGVVCGNVEFNSIKKTESGGGVYVAANSALTMNGGDVAYNYAAFYGGGIGNRGVFKLTGGSIFRNRSQSSGGGVFTGCDSDLGSAFTMTGGMISGNESKMTAGGLGSDAYAIVRLLGGSIITNKSVKAGGVESGYGANASYTLGGDIKIFDNTLSDGKTPNNLYFYENNTVAITNDPALATGAKIGVTMESGTGVFATGATEADLACFTSDDSAYVLEYADGKIALESPRVGLTVTPVIGASKTTVLTNGAPTTADWVRSNSVVSVIYEADKDYMFPGGYKTLTTNVTASAATVTVTLTAEQQPRPAEACEECITFSSKGAFKVQLKKGVGAPTVNLEYSTDKTYWESYTLSTDYDAVKAGDDYAIYLRGTGNTQFAYNASDFEANIFTLANNGVGGVACSGNIETLLDYKTVEAGDHPKMDAYAFSCLFRSSSALTAAPMLLATNLTDNCYRSMFEGCASLANAPELPAETLAKECYENMFCSCKVLTAAPMLPATNLAESCYSSMFNECASLANAPELPAETLAKKCYSYMFCSCKVLTAAPKLPATTLATECYRNMFQSCYSLTAAPELPATNLAESCYIQMFNACNALTDVPELPATNLVKNCYSTMFINCAKLVVNTNEPGKAWMIPDGAKASAGTAENWNSKMFGYTSGNITSTAVTPGVTYYVKSAWKPVTVELPEVEGATAQLLAFNVNGGWTATATNEVPSNATVRVVWTAADGKALSDEGATGVFMWQTEFGPVVGGEVAPAPTVVEAGESSVTLDIDTRTTKRYFETDDILPIWYAAGAAEVKVKKSKLEGEVEESTETLVKNAANTNTVAWTPASVGVYDFSHTGDLTAQIIYTTPVEVTTNDLEVAGTTVAVTVDGAALPEDGNIPSNSVVTATWTATGSGAYFADGSTTYTQTFEADKAVNPVGENVTKPEGPAEPKVLLGVVAQRYPWDGKVDVQYWAKNTPNEGYEITVTVTLPNGTEASETYDCKNGKNTVAFDARAKFGEVQFPKGVKVKATLVEE